MSNQKQSHPQHGDGGNNVIYNYGTLVYVTGDQNNVVGQVISSGSPQPKAPQRRSLQLARHGLPVMMRFLAIAAGCMAYWVMNGAPPFM